MLPRGRYKVHSEGLLDMYDALREQLAAMSREELLELRKEHEELVEQMGERDQDKHKTSK